MISVFSKMIAKCRDVLPPLSLTLTSAPAFAKATICSISSLTTAPCIGIIGESEKISALDILGTKNAKKKTIKKWSILFLSKTYLKKYYLHWVVSQSLIEFEKVFNRINFRWTPRIKIAAQA